MLGVDSIKKTSNERRLAAKVIYLVEYSEEGLRVTS